MLIDGKMTAQLIVDIQVVSESATIPVDKIIESWAAAVLDQLGFSDFAEMSIRIVDEDEIRALNRAYREVDKPTNVLSFPSGIGSDLPDDVPRSLGDVVICAPVVEREAAVQFKAVGDHWAHLVVHGTLHLLGFDHSSESDAAEMEAAERDILASKGVVDPYAHRSEQM